MLGIFFELFNVEIVGGISVPGCLIMAGLQLWELKKKIKETHLQKAYSGTHEAGLGKYIPQKVPQAAKRWSAQ